MCDTVRSRAIRLRNGGAGRLDLTLRSVTTALPDCALRMTLFAFAVISASDDLGFCCIARWRRIRLTDQRNSPDGARIEAMATCLVLGGHSITSRRIRLGRWCAKKPYGPLA